MIRYSLLFIGALVLLQAWGVDISSLAILASALGIGIGFGLQDIAKDIGSGLVRFALPDFKRRKVDYGWGFPGAISPDGKTLAFAASQMPDGALGIYAVQVDGSPCPAGNNQRLVRRILEARGFQVLLAGDGPDGIAVARELRPNLILVDINIPGLDGYETTTRLRGMGHLSGAPIVAVSLLYEIVS